MKMYWSFCCISFLLLSIVWRIGANEKSPLECRNYTSLAGENHQRRYLNFTSVIPTNIHDAGMVDVWFRFEIPNANRILQNDELPEKIFVKSADRSKFTPCGSRQYSFTSFIPGQSFEAGAATSAIYVLADFHPRRKFELYLTSAIPCQYYAVTNNVKMCDPVKKDCNFQKACENKFISIAVRNCGDFYVYKLLQAPKIMTERRPSFGGGRSKPGIVCGTKEILPEVSEPEQCNSTSYIVNNERNREWNYKSNFTAPNFSAQTRNCDEDSNFMQNTWVRFQQLSTNSSMKIAENCPSFVTNSGDLLKYSYCGALFRGWIQGNHPTVEEGASARTICFSKANTCECEFSQEILITNCGGFYVYRRRSMDFPHCLARACVVPDEKEIISTTSISTVHLSTSVVTSQLSMSPSSSPVTSMTRISATKSVSLTPSEMVQQSLVSMNMSSSMSKLMMSSSQMMDISPSASTAQLQSSIFETTNLNAEPLFANVSGGSMSNSYVQPSMMSIPPSNSSVSSASSMETKERSSMISSVGSTMKMSVIPSKSSLTPLTSSSVIPTPEIKMQSLCNDFKTIIDDSRLLTSWLSLTNKHAQCNLRYYNAVRFLTTRGESLKITDECQVKDLPARTCSSFDSNVWLSNPYPKEAGLHLMLICIREDRGFSAPFSLDFCNCDRTEPIYIEQCTKNGETFYVYRLYPLFNTVLDRPNSKKCNLRYCAELEPGTTPVITTKRPTIPKKKEIFAVRGEFTIKEPSLNGAPVTSKLIADKSSEEYQFLESFLKQMIFDALIDVSGISRVEIIGFRIGSLIVEYKVYGDSSLKNKTIDDEITKSLEKNPVIDTTTDTNSISGILEPKSQKLSAVDQCASKPCHMNATCTNHANNTFSCECHNKFYGDGFICDFVVHVSVLETEIDNEWSDDSIIIVSVLFAACFVFIVILAFCLCCRHSAGYSTKNVFTRGTTNYDNYYSTDAPSKDKNLEMPVVQNMYMTSDPSEMNKSSTFAEEKVPL